MSSTPHGPPDPGPTPLLRTSQAGKGHHTMKPARTDDGGKKMYRVGFCNSISFDTMSTLVVYGPVNQGWKSDYDTCTHGVEDFHGRKKYHDRWAVREFHLV